MSELLLSSSSCILRTETTENRNKINSGRSRSATESLFSCVANRKGTRRKGHPAWRLPGIGQPLLRCLNSCIHALAMPGKSVRRGGAFRQHSGNCSCVTLTPTSMPSPVLAKRSRFLSTPAARPAVPTSPPDRGPDRAAGYRDPHFSEEPEPKCTADDANRHFILIQRGRRGKIGFERSLTTRRSQSRLPMAFQTPDIPRRARRSISTG